jgi:hypothetical protein
MLSKNELIAKFNNLNSDNVIQYLYNGHLTKDELYNFFDYDLFKDHSNVIIKNFGSDVYKTLESDFVKKMIQKNVPIDYFKQRFNCNLLERYNNILITAYGNDVVKEWLNSYNISSSL